MTDWLLVCVVTIVIVALTNVLTSRVVTYTLSVEIASDVRSAYDAIRLQKNCRQWATCPGARSSVAPEEDADGKVGAKLVFFGASGREVGRQTVASLEEDAKVTLQLSDPAPFQCQTQQLSFALSATPRGVRVDLHFLNRMRPPFHVVLRAAGLDAWLRDFHRADLDALKRFLEQRSLDSKKTS